MALPAPVAIVGLSCFVILLVEVLTVLFVSNSSGFKRIVADIDRTSKELERLASAGAASTTSAQKKRERALEVQLTYMSRDFFYYRMKQYAIMSVSLATMFYVLRTWYMGKSVAKLPFAPMFPFSRLAHQWLEKPGANDCSFMFLYVICNIGIKPNIAKLMGTQLPANVQKATDMQSMTSRFAKLTTGRGV
ncbi:hypothetical protein VOLCADRAFT_109592 [Volvox carteri f. nagariensis]|uniref:Uncharacterized protein n=1 Tax=Volvox carteri f. nagariensis TaxID=3068 RepID=D8TJV0_VOLCA|nr:uncharacterized protein VOLCADRAFT_109592 [Volvox carteri f. nagariensis]EFJ51952.1 hypothetical protein VOLCADRAFT_109592 [Volvox carteri f. nagariensis]|eukprot:XP_002946726.1 hypothetical protein VOLCADRAFT_109592 [Volvox carteri f. nagariensis]